MMPRTNFQLARIFGIRIGVGMSWFFILFLLIYFLSQYYFHELLGGSQSTVYTVAVIGALGYFASLIMHELGHALTARRLGIEVTGIDLWFFGGVSHMRREPHSAGQELLIAIAGPAVTLSLFLLCMLVGWRVGGGQRFFEVAFTGVAFKPTPALAVVCWLGFINALLFVFNMVPAFPLDGGRIARALVWWRTGDRHRGTRVTGRAGQLFAVLLGILGMLWLANGEGLGIFTLMLGIMLYQAAGGAVVQGNIGARMQSVTVADIMDTEPVTIEGQTGLMDAQENFFSRYRWPWFAVTDTARHFLGVVRAERVQAEIAAGRPALSVSEVLEQDLPVLIDEQAPLESLLRAEGLRRLGAMVAVDGEGVLQGVVTIAQIQQALRPAAGP